jgi:hypothetical protein
MWYPQIQAMLGKLYVLSLYFTLYAPTFFFLSGKPCHGVLYV